MLANLFTTVPFHYHYFATLQPFVDSAESLQISGIFFPLLVLFWFLCIFVLQTWLRGLFLLVILLIISMMCSSSIQVLQNWQILECELFIILKTKDTGGCLVDLQSTLLDTRKIIYLLTYCGAGNQTYSSYIQGMYSRISFQVYKTDIWKCVAKNKWLLCFFFYCSVLYV